VREYARAPDAGAARERFVWVEDDGSARELTQDEADHLSTPFYGDDGSRPYVKWRYKSLTPDGRIGGYLKRRKLPKSVPVRPLDSSSGIG
jgi:hypothetical protein